MIFHSTHKYAVREECMHEIQEVFKLTLLDNLVIVVGSHSSCSVSYKNCIPTCASRYLWYIESPPMYPKTKHISIGRPLEYYSATKKNTQEDTLLYLGNQIIWLRVWSSLLSWFLEVLGRVLLFDLARISESYSIGKTIFCINLEYPTHWHGKKI